MVDSDNTNNHILKEERWHNQQLLILKGWSEICASYRWLHYRTHIRYKIKNYCYMIPVIIMSTITGTANFAQAQVPAFFMVYTPLIIGTINILSAIITTIYQFAKISELMESHRISSINYGKLSRNIDIQINLPEQYRTISGSDFIKETKAELDRLIDQGHTIPKDLLRTYNIIAVRKGVKQPEISQFNRKTIYGVDDNFIQKKRVKKKSWFGLLYDYLFNKNIPDVADISTNTDSTIKREEYEIISRKISEKVLVDSSMETTDNDLVLHL